jgi:hypothetical protein
MRHRFSPAPAAGCSPAGALGGALAGPSLPGPLCGAAQLPPLLRRRNAAFARFDASHAPPGGNLAYPPLALRSRDVGAHGPSGQAQQPRQLAPLGPVLVDHPEQVGPMFKRRYGADAGTVVPVRLVETVQHSPQQERKAGGGHSADGSQQIRSGGAPTC